MSNKHSSSLSIIEAVETLSHFAELEVKAGKKSALENAFFEEKNGERDKAVETVKGIYKILLRYLRHHYHQEHGVIMDPKAVEGIKNIMVLVGESAKKLDRYQALFHQARDNSVTNCKEYRRLQEFYLKRIAKKVDESMLGKWILAIAQRQMEQQVVVPAKKIMETKHIFVDLETVKRDFEYELFFIRKEDGSRFFNPRLLRNIELVCDFGEHLGLEREPDPLVDLKYWQDRIWHVCAKTILKALGSQLDRYYQRTRHLKDHDLVMALNKTLMALMLSAHPQHLAKNRPTKTCAEYFLDFQVFLSEAVKSRTYQKWIAYPPKESNDLALDLISLVDTLCRSLYVHLQSLSELTPIIKGLLAEASRLQSSEHIEEALSSGMLWNRLACDYAAMNKLLKQHPHGPLLKVLQVMEADAYHLWDPLTQQNLPYPLFDLHLPDRHVTCLRLPAPITQEVIHKAAVNEEFKAFLRSTLKPGNKRRHLLINLQDRTSWREYARCHALEELAEQSDFKDAISVITLGIDTDFTHQAGEYEQVNHADTFMSQLKDQVESKTTGYYFPPEIKRALFFGFVDECMDAVHCIFFSGRNVLKREDRQDFIQIFMLFLTLKVIDIIKPDSFSFSCKDGVDMGGSYSGLLFAFLTLLHQPELSAEELDHLNAILYGPALFIRERAMLSGPFNRMVSALKVIENARQEFGQDQFAKRLHESLRLLFKAPLIGPETSVHLR